MTLPPFFRWRSQRKPSYFIFATAIALSASLPTIVRSEETSETVDFPKEQWEIAGIQLSKPVKQRYSEQIRLTGMVSLNEDRLSHVYPIVEGVVDQVAIALGDVVEKDQMLAVVHSREVGQAKLELFQARLELEIAEAKSKVQQELSGNTNQLLDALRNQKEISEIQSQLQNRNMGEYRERLLNAYADYLKAQADVVRLEGIAQSGAVSGKQLLAAQTRRNADLATFQARIEQIAFELQSAVLMTSQAVKSAKTRVAVAITSLKILGCNESEVQTIDPIQQGESISHYSIRAPFGGTVIAKDVTLGEQIRRDKQLLTIADLSTVWIKADVYEKDVPLLSALAGRDLELSSEAWPGQTFHAKVFYTGEIMDEATRTIGMRAIAENKDHLLKPGMFVTIELPATATQESVQVPATAVQQYENETFVFVHEGDGKFARRDVTVGNRGRQWAVIEKGLAADETIVTSGGFILKSKMLEGLLAEE
ncbi:efflux RND transporter periplasmic adaptor subunit [Rhodopirellula sp. MGV]|uniref:efflux RND transporter periplasmic adaptor subunit n=1 Tax=Rhodopirellula sp. MGV TaxID=2023130 RepID=UPI001304608F|nr:efflux RND transporter periplasmic adaptor subunit [Rhodopirellula sp. MGV]